MNDAVEKMSSSSSSSLAIVEQKPQRPGGCVGVLFQLFDWNRRFAKKKLFAKKLIPPVRSRQLLKNYGGNEKQLKLRLIADENSGGFPNAKKNNGVTNVDLEQSHEMRSPSLVARLMGLESMPALQKNKSKKVPLSGFGSDKEEKKLMSNGFGHLREEVNIEKGRSKHELRPQKLQKTSGENQPMTRIGTEAMGFKNVLSRSKKHHPKLPSPAKSPRNLSRKNASKLIGAATRILEPGLQTSRSKCALTCSNTLHHPPKRQTVMEEMIDSDNFASAVRKGQASRRNCGHFLDNLDSKPCSAHEPSVFAPPISRCVESSCQWSERCNSGQSSFYQELQEELHDNYGTVAAPVMDNLQPCVKVTSDTSPFTGRRQRHFSRQHHNPRKDFSPLSYNHSLQSPHQMLRTMDRVPPRSIFNSLQSDRVSTATVVSEAKNCASSNRIFSRSTNSLVYSRMNDYKFEMGKRIIKKENESVPPGRKRRPANSRDGEIYVSRSPTTKNQMHSSPHAMSAKGLGYNVPSINQQWRRGGLPHLQQRMDGSGEVNNHVVSFAFSSPAKQQNGVEKRRVESDSICSATLEKSAFSDDGRTKFEKPSPLNGDALGALLKQKLNELTSQGEDTGGDAPKKTTAMILQELISALTSEIPFHQNKSADGKFSISNDSHLPNRASFTSSQTNAMEVKLSGDQPLDGEHLSPGSVLEAYFSNHSCLSSSVDDSLGHKILNESGDCSYDEPPLLNPNSELSDSATSRNKTKSSNELTDILNNISETLCCIDLANCDLKGSNLDRANEVLLKSELIFHTTPVVQGSLSIKHLLLDEMETLASLLWINFGSSLGVADFREVSQLNRLVFDSVIEYLDLRFGEYPNCKVLTKLPLRTNINMLLFEIVEEVRRWGELSRYILDDLIEREMSHSGAEWTEFEVETVEAGMDISRHVFQDLLDEIVMDFDDSSVSLIQLSNAAN